MLKSISLMIYSSTASIILGRSFTSSNKVKSFEGYLDLDLQNLFQIKEFQVQAYLINNV